MLRPWAGHSIQLSTCVVGTQFVGLSLLSPWVCIRIKPVLQAKARTQALGFSYEMWISHSKKEDFLISFKGTVAGGGRDREQIFHLLLHCSKTTVVGVGLAWNSKSLGLHLSLPHVWQGLKHLDHLPLSSRGEQKGAGLGTAAGTRRISCFSKDCWHHSKNWICCHSTSFWVSQLSL